MSVQPRQSGAAAVGRIAELPPIERQVIRCLRLWSDGPGGREVLNRELAARHGSEKAARLLADFAELMQLTARHARRPLLNHAPDSSSAGADECVFARFVALAAEGSREDAALMATLLVRPDLALCLAGLAEMVGLGLMRHAAPQTVQ